ncbi:hypothetical protein M422DRAFT_263989 [Sphaerobolus stellatus SS14]|uniref:Uncharacterized protein n=1 Tax=Sphaerobolus stellatus (strain SS14) TaxID=990650 RepID=A0A0C9UXL9_SPHS4|nr:hypothetical protein M422DRAFT_263989 [Sphaerobolus stellatus SS14]
MAEHIYTIIPPPIEPILHEDPWLQLETFKYHPSYPGNADFPMPLAMITMRNVWQPVVDSYWKVVKANEEKEWKQKEKEKEKKWKWLAEDISDKTVMKKKKAATSTPKLAPIVESSSDEGVGNRESEIIAVNHRMLRERGIVIVNEDQLNISHMFSCYKGEPQTEPCNHCRYWVETCRCANWICWEVVSWKVFGEDPLGPDASVELLANIGGDTEIVEDVMFPEETLDKGDEEDMEQGSDLQTVELDEELGEELDEESGEELETDGEKETPKAKVIPPKVAELEALGTTSEMTLGKEEESEGDSKKVEGNDLLTKGKKSVKQVVKK